MLKMIRFILNAIINDKFDTVMMKAIGLDDLVNNGLPVKFPTKEQIYEAAHSACRNYGDGTYGRALAFHRVGLIAQQIGEEPAIIGSQEIEGGIIVKVFLSDEASSFKIVVYGDDAGTWQYITDKGRA